MPNLGLLIRRRREELGFTQAYVADEAAVEQDWISRFERGILTNVELARLTRVADTLRLEVTLRPVEPQALHKGCSECGALTLDGADFCAAHTPAPSAA